MSDELSINADKNNTVDLEMSNEDITATGLKVLSGWVPVAGPLLNEIINVVIPNQRTDRLKLFAEVLDMKFNNLEKDFVDVKTKTEKFVDLLEDALPMAARAFTHERREYIANFLVHSLSTEENAKQAEKKLLSLLDQLNDAEIIFLKYKAIQSHSKKDEFYQTHEHVLQPIPTHNRSPRAEWEKQYLRRSYQDILISLGLIKATFKVPRKGETPEFDEKTGMLKISYDSASGLGETLLRYIDDSYKGNRYADDEDEEDE